MEDIVPPRPAPRRRVAERVLAWIHWFGAARLVASAVSVVLVAAAAFWLLRTPRPSTESQLPYAPAVAARGAPAAAGSTTTFATTSTQPTPSTASVVVVHVAGAVVAPGVYRLPPGARVVDAIAAAGGLADGADGNGVNLAAALRDGTRVYVPRVGESAPPAAGVGDVAGASASTAAAGPLDLNSAGVEDLDRLPGVGPSTAAAIVAYRDAHGPFGNVDDLAEVRGIGPAKLDALRGLVTT